ncbi:hypothetical protein [Variovorax paradoxus]|uniref:Meckel syndrome type 1 protein n=1 Tax=Variovorax paradoxus TaxID=34073 RepID=A0A0H2M566_VARPD|nr:hypothetical protein [Variovorax paradoxus]KLN57478.1 hypothetical protein VPARA_15590 [Variovorax paradoxus]
MSNSSGNDTPDFDGGEDATLRDPALRRALDHAPDSDALPDTRTRDAIRKMAHNLAPVPATTPAAEDKGAASWWRRLFGGGGSHARMPWNAAFATVLLATFVTVLWHREPVPDARLDGEARVTSAPAAAPEAAPSVAAVPGPTATQAPAPAPAEAPAPAAAPAPAPTPAPARAQPQPDAARDAVSEESMRSRDIAVRRSAPPPSDKQAAAPAPEPQTSQAAPEPPPLPASLPAPAPPAAAIAPAPPPAAMAAAAPPAAREAASDSASGSSPALSAPQRSPSAEAASGVLRSAPAPRAAVVAGKAGANPAEGAAAFSALDQWISLNATGPGQSVRHARGDTEGLAALVNTLARSATAPGAELAAPVEARLELYRGATLLAVLEIAGDQVRWTPQGPALGALVGTPPAQSLAELKALLARR